MNALHESYNGMIVAETGPALNKVYPMPLYNHFHPPSAIVSFKHV